MVEENNERRHIWRVMQVLPSMYTDVVHGKCTFEKFSEAEIMVTAEIDFFAHVLRFQEGSL